MTSLFQAVNSTATTDNGAKAHHSSLDASVDLFYLAGASRGKDISAKFTASYAHNKEQTLRILQWLRDVRQGAGERQQFRDLFKLSTSLGAYDDYTVSSLSRILEKLPELGRYDDLLWIYENVVHPVLNQKAIDVFVAGLKSGNGLAYKYTPIKGNTAKVLRKIMGFHKEVDWRKHVVSNRKTVEQQMCAKEWDEIEFGKVPSLASARYQKAFGRNAPTEYSAYISSLVKGEAKINAGAVYPYDIVKSVKQGNSTVADAQWKALPDFLEGNTTRILPLIDVSGSMDQSAGGSKVITCMDVAVSLGLYLSERAVGAFKDTFISFHVNPQMFKVSGTLSQRVVQTKSTPWGGSTNLERVFEVVLNAAVLNKVSSEEMPEVIVVFSDMQFNQAFSRSGTSVTLFEKIDELYNKAGYKRPQIVFWNLNASNTTTPVESGTAGSMLVSGFSPSLMKSIFKGNNPNTTPLQAMLDVIMVERYDI